ncbi:hypothetical protein CIW49_15915 [Mycolicibacterium sp. P1-18]|nr:hypothetical protein CIW49_15915 [Mycolicibacterium sp. P1-18]
MRSSQRDLILYELNEVPWSIVDYFVEKRPHSNLAALLDGGLSVTTVNTGPETLTPWRTWPSLHNSMYDHNSFDLGQDPTTFRGEPIWNVAEKAGLSVGLFGPMQSWPARQFAHGGFYVPDTFSQDSETFPATMRGFQDFNLSMTQTMAFDANVALDPKALARAGVDMLRHGVTPRSMATVARHLVRERKDYRHKAFRAALQVLPGFDLYWKLHVENNPRLSVFFTNHVASMMHRFWGDAMPGYTDLYDYTPDDVFGGFIEASMELADQQFGRIRKYLAANPRTVLVVAASMGQEPVETRFGEADMLLLEDHDRFAAHLGLNCAEWALAMYPMLSAVFADEEDARNAVAPIESVVAEGIGPVFSRVRLEGKTVTFLLRGYETAVAGAGSGPDVSSPMTFTPAGSAQTVTAAPAELGFTTRTRTGGDNSGNHIPQGMLLAYGAGIGPDPARREVDVLDVAPSLLANVLGVGPGPMMQGTPSLFVGDI